MLWVIDSVDVCANFIINHAVMMALWAFLIGIAIINIYNIWNKDA